MAIILSKRFRQQKNINLDVSPHIIASHIGFYAKLLFFQKKSHNSCSSVSIYGRSKGTYEEGKENHNVVISEKVSESNQILIIVLVMMSLHIKESSKKNHIQLSVNLQAL